MQLLQEAKIASVITFTFGGYHATRPVCDGTMTPSSEHEIVAGRTRGITKYQARQVVSRTDWL
ncbi:hypothetical protein BN1232_03063 [Mycobacterium lentiflavum]|uniref:Uncharacterized protein n=1 Tax=Mycobacterium lentiflavum TaxID=141349 RepID=A0A0E4GYF3_MYCLN|nr:hypothetical protein BN1232_03063 [Mycobacterium lentiflavum]